MNIQEMFSLTVNADEERSHVEMTGVIPKEKIQEVRSSVLNRLKKEKNMDGFRKGAAPDDIVEKTVGSLEVWRQGAHEVIMRNFPEIVAAEHVAPLGQPQLQLISIPDNGDVTFRISFFTMPRVQLPDYASVVKTVVAPEEITEVSDEDVRQVLLDIRRGIYKREHPDRDPPADEKELPEITDERVREISQQHNDKEGFVTGLRESIIAEKNMQTRMEFRQKLMNAVIAETTVSIPEILIEEEKNRAYEDFKKQAEHFGTTVEKYLEAQGMTEEQLVRQFREDAKKRAQTQLVLNAVSAKEHIHADRESVEKESARFKQRANDMTDEQIHTYIESMLTNEAVLQFLERQNKGA